MADAAPASHFRLAFILVLAVTAARLLTLAFQTAPLSMDEAQYWIWSRDPAWGYFSKPPLLAWLIAASTSVCGDGETCVRLTAPLMHALTALTVFGIGARLFDGRTGLWSALGYILLPGVSVSSVVISTDAPLLLCWAVALYALVRALGEPGLRWWLLLGVAGGLGLLGKYAMAYFLLCAAVLALIDTQARAKLLSRGAAAALIVASLIALPNVLWNAANGFVSYRHVLDNMAADETPFRIHEFLNFVASQFGVFGPLLFGALLVATWGLRRAGSQTRVLAAFTWPVLLLMTGQALLSRAHANWAAVSYIAAVVWVSAWAVHGVGHGAARRMAVLRISVVLHILAAETLYNFEALAQAFHVTLTRRIDPLVRVRDWDKAGAWSSGLYAQCADCGFLFDDRNTMTELIYYTRPHPDVAAMWNPSDLSRNHFEMTSDLMRHSDKRFIYVTRLPDAGLVSASFSAVRSLGMWQAKAYPGHEMMLNAFLLTGFRGYTGSADSTEPLPLSP